MNPEYEAALLQLRQGLPCMWWSLYQGCLDAGFDQRQSFGLVQTHILSQNPNGIRPDNPSGPKSDDPNAG